jgi:predicted RNase H-like HicB family nuclease
VSEEQFKATTLRVTLGLETQASGMISASVIEFPDCHVEATTREEAIAKVQAVFLERLPQIETIPWDVPLPSKEIAPIESAGIFRANSAFEDVMNRIQSEREAWGEEEMDVSEYMR